MNKSQIIETVFRELAHRHQIDSSVIWPDDLFEDFGLQEADLIHLTRSCLDQIQSDHFGDGPIPAPRTARELVDWLILACEQCGLNTEEQRAA